MSSFPLTNSIIFQRGRAQPPTSYNYDINYDYNYNYYDEYNINYDVIIPTIMMIINLMKIP